MVTVKSYTENIGEIMKMVGQTEKNILVNNYQLVPDSLKQTKSFLRLYALANDIKLKE